jgi:hypothetical protein
MTCCPQFFFSLKKTSRPWKTVLVAIEWISKPLDLVFFGIGMKPSFHTFNLYLFFLMLCHTFYV